MTYEPTKEDVERAVQILNTHFPTRRGEFYRAISEALYSHHRALAERGVFVAEWQPIETAPKDGTYVLLAGPSGYTTTPIRVEIGHWDAEFSPHQPWVTYSNDSFTDSGDAPTHWMPLPQEPKP